MKKYIFLVAALMLAAVAALPPSQVFATPDPLHGNYTLANSAEIVMVWAESTNSSSTQTFQKIYDFLALNNPELPDQLDPQTVQTETGALGTAGDRAMDVLIGDLNGDNIDDLVALWEGPERSINLIVPQVSAGTLDWSNSNALSIAPAGSLIDQHQTQRQIRLVGGFFDDDPQPEFLVAYWGADSAIHLTLYDTDGTFSPQPGVSLAPEHTLSLTADGPSMVERSAWFDVTTGDLDGDGTDEVVMAAGQPLACDRSSGCWQVTLRVYDVDALGGRIVPRSQTILFSKADNSSLWLERLSLATGDFNGDLIEEVAVGFEVADNSSESIWYLQFLQAALAEFDPDGSPLGPGQWGSESDPSTIQVDLNDRFRVDQTNGSRGYPLSVVAADLNGDGQDELLYAARQLKIYELDTDLRPRQIAGGGLGTLPGTGSHRVLAVADLDADNDLAQGSSEWRPEIIVAVNQTFSLDGGINTDGRFLLRVFSFTPGAFNLETRADLIDEVSENSSPRPFVLAAGDFGGNGIRVGRPQRYSKTEIVEPLVVLNAPPTHFDVFGDSAFDINGCYGDSRCEFASVYKKTNTQSVQMETTLNSDWAVGLKASGGATIPLIDVGVKATLKTRYGQKFSKRRKSGQRVTVSQEVSAIADDRIYAMVIDYDIWEYPVISSGATTGHIAVVVPKLTQNRWFPSKSWSANSYIPAHEVGNILSYLEVIDPADNPALEQAIRFNAADGQVLDRSSLSSWSLTFEAFTANTSSSEAKRSISSSVDFDIPVPFIPNIGLSGDYSSSTVSTFSSKVSESIAVEVNLGGIDTSFGETSYIVTPYSYWAKNGTLVVDYAVKPELSDFGFTPTWWQDRYGNQADPAFILPWLHDAAKGGTLQDPAKRYQTRDIIFSPADAAPGEGVTLIARLQNYSLLPTPGAVAVRFFAGDPDQGGVPIVGNNGETEVFTEGPIPARGNAAVRMQWTVPNLPFVRVYAVLDPAGSMPEIHETNNKGWNVLSTLTEFATFLPASGLMRIPSVRVDLPGPSGVTSVYVAVDLKLIGGLTFGLEFAEVVSPSGITQVATFNIDTGRLELPAIRVDVEGTTGIDTFYFEAGMQLTADGFLLDTARQLAQ